MQDVSGPHQYYPNKSCTGICGKFAVNLRRVAVGLAVFAVVSIVCNTFIFNRLQSQFAVFVSETLPKTCGFYALIIR